jgi:hypothetical protein
MQTEVEEREEIQGLASNGNAGSRQRASVLSDWKLIGHYLGKSVRTVQRWEREFGLPVRRVHGRPRSCVIAVPAEIDAWVQARMLCVEDAGSSKLEQMLRLLQSVRELRTENRRLRQQLESERAKRQ